MRFVALMYTEPARTRAMTAEEHVEIKRKYEELGTELLASGELRNGCGMAYPAETRTLRRRREPADGPFHTGDTLLSAYWVLDCASPERAEAIAERMLDWHVTAVEVRAVHDSFGFGEDEGGDLGVG
ncbi:YciI family protein [Actinophytocola sp.]|uniref:YciI family protein n=1 Tax=Actinophytocola sp. TaxID=1872138 RepID=UPI00389ABB79